MEQSEQKPVKKRQSWETRYKDIMDYMLKNKRRPSKHHVEDLSMHNWIKYNKKRRSRGLMTEERAQKFDILLATARKYRRLNQLQYMHPENLKD